MTAFKAARLESGVQGVVAHASLLLNLASSNADLHAKSVQHLAAEIHRAQRLGISAIVVHPGSNPDLKTGLEQIVAGLDLVADNTRGVQVLLETVAGQGNSIGWRFEHLGDILASVARSDRFGVCVDTCHVFAAGYDLRTRDAYHETIDELGSYVGIERIQAFHVNDSKVAFGRRVDRHAPIIGEGHIGLLAFHTLLHDPRFSSIPMIAEVPDTERLTHQNVNILKDLRARSDPPNGTVEPQSLFA